MQGTILHYDSLTGCGLFRPEAGQPIAFRQNQLIDARTVSPGQVVTYIGSGDGLTIVTRTTAQNPAISSGAAKTNSVSDQYKALIDSEPTPKQAEPVTYLEAKLVQSNPQQMSYSPPPTPTYAPQQPGQISLPGGLYNWPGTLVATAAFGLLLAAGQGSKPGNQFDKNVPLINSLWGMCAAALLAMTTYWQAVGMSRGRVRSAVWGVAVCSIMAYLLQGCQGFVADGAAQWYIYAVVVLFLIVYILPYRVRF
ncbi:MAG: flagella basal body P-ring formation protein FlgA [Rudanella sp.]|nr:flagella basal body P-ring formation protein FlgA [Rudanella sp.]